MRRRGFLRLGLLGGGLLALSSVGLGMWPALLRHAPRRKLELLDEMEFAVLAAVAARVVTQPDADPIELAHRVEEAVRFGAPESQDDFKKLLRLLENGFAGMLLDLRPRPFTRLPPEAQDAALLAFRDSRLALRRSGYHALRRLTAAAYYSNISTWAGLGYPGPPSISVPT
ncbi:MAG: hypothetical protein EXR72_01275 [Myxococcales bacterium]|nr:hypothetical protein [Myxococcales bacterium]